MPNFRLAELVVDRSRRLARCWAGRPSSRRGAGWTSLPLVGFLLAASALAGCASPERSAPPAGTVLPATDPLLIGPNVTESAVVRVDGFDGPEYHEVWYRYSAMLQKGSVRVTDNGALELVDGTLFVHSRRESRRISVDTALKQAAWARADLPGDDGSLVDAAGPGPCDIERLLALQIIDQPSSVTTQQRALWWYPIVVSDPTQQGTVGTNFIVQRSVDASGNATSRVFLRPPLQRLFAPPSRVWLASAEDPKAAKGAGASGDQGVAWLLGTDVFAESVRGPQGVETRILPVDGTLAKELEAIDEQARKLGVR